MSVELRVAREQLRIQRGEGDIIERKSNVAKGRKEGVGCFVKPRIEALCIFGSCHGKPCQNRLGRDKAKRNRRYDYRKSPCRRLELGQRSTLDGPCPLQQAPH